MNTLQPVTPMDFYEERRRDVEINNNSIESLRQEIASLTGAPQPQAPTMQPTDIASLTVPGSPEELGTSPSDLFIKEQEERSTFSKVMSGVEWVTSPLVAIGDAALAPIAHDYENEGFVGQLGEAFKVSGNAFLSRAFPEYGQEHEDYGGKIAERIAPNAPDAVKGMIGTTLGMISDPTIAIGLPSAKVIQRGLRVSRDTAIAKGKPYSGIYQEGLHEILTVGKGVDPKELGNIGELAKRADEGDINAIGELHSILDNDENILDAVTKADDADVKKIINDIEMSVGRQSDDMVSFRDVESPTPEALLKDTINTNNQAVKADLNLSRLNTEDDLDNVIINVGEHYREQFKQIAGSQSNAETMTKAQNAQLTDLIGRKTTDFAAEDAYALRQMLVSSADNLQKLAIKADASKSAYDELAFNKAVAVHRAIQAKATGVKSHAGRLLQQYNMTAKSSREFIKQVNTSIEATADNKFQKELLKKLVSSTDNPAAINKLTNKSAYAKTADALYEVYVNAILSGPATHLVNVTSNALMVGMRPTEKLLESMSAAARGKFNEARVNADESIAMMQGVVQGIGDAMRLLTNKESITSLGLPEDVVRAHELASMQNQRAISAEELGAQGKLGHAIDALGNFIRLPGDMLLKEDLAFKTIHNRIEINAQAARKAMSANADNATTRQIYNALRANPDEHMRQSAKDMMGYYTFTNELGNMGTKVHQAIQATPLKIMIPFFRTPVNIIKMGVRHSVFGNIFKGDIKNITKMNAAGDKARAKVALGTMIPATIIGLLDDNITGHIDEKTPTGRFKANNGTPPYSIKIGDEWYDYSRLEPIRTILGLYTNYRDAINNIETVDPDTGEPNSMVDELTVAAIAPMIQTVGDNFMLNTTGHIIYMLESIQSGNPDYAKKTFARMAASATPYSGAMRQTTQMIDPTFRQAEEYSQQFRAIIPGLSKDLPARKTIWGDDQHVVEGLGIEVMSPVRTQSVNVDKVDQELIDLEVRIPGQPKKITINGVELELTPHQQEQFSVIRGKGVEGSPSLKEAMTLMYDDPMFQMLPPEMKKEKYEWMFNKATDMAKKYIFAADAMLQFQYESRLQARRKLMEHQ